MYTDKGTKEQLLSFLREYVTDHKKTLFDEVLSRRTRHITIVLEDVFKPHNASAVIRTAECMGIQDIHVIENENRCQVNPYVTKGATKWLDLFHYNKPETNNTLSCLDTLKKKGYKIYATSPAKGCRPEEIPLDEKIALIFGTEFSGISISVKENADGFVNIPMYGFTESYNLSVSAAICMYSVMNRLYESTHSWQFSEEEKRDIKLQWFRAVVPRSEQLVNKFFGEKRT